jgi:hypothetical protein
MSEPADGSVMPSAIVMRPESSSSDQRSCWAGEKSAKNCPW